jgi:5-bromo-4-chloroindolyl phosphate hydrolysis protein
MEIIDLKGNFVMKYSVLLLSLFMLLTISACAKRSPEAQKQEAEAEYMNEKTDTLKEYKECVKNSNGADDKMKQCDALLKAVQAVEGTQAPAPAAQ